MCCVLYTTEVCFSESYIKCSRALFNVGFFFFFFAMWHQNGHTALMIAAEHNLAEISELLVEQGGADVNAQVAVRRLLHALL